MDAPTYIIPFLLDQKSTKHSTQLTFKGSFVSRALFFHDCIAEIHFCVLIYHIRQNIGYLIF